METKVKALLGEHTAYIERTNLTSRQMNGRIVRKTTAGFGECRKITGHLDKSGVEIHGVDIAVACPVGQQLLRAVDRLEKQEVRDIRNAT